MRKIKDRILLGIVTGLVASLPGRVLNEVEHNLRYTDMKYEETSANLFTSQNSIHSPIGRAIGFVANGTLTAIAGIVTSYTLSATGRDHAVIKGIGIKMLFWMTFESLPSKLGLTRKPKKPLAPLLSVVNHVIFGACCGFLASKLGEDSLFPDEEVKQGEKLPLVSKPSQMSKNKAVRIWRLKRHYE